MAWGLSGLRARGFEMAFEPEAPFNPARGHAEAMRADTARNFQWGSWFRNSKT